MTRPPLAPSRLTRALLRLTASADAANATIGDILEEFEQRVAAGRAPRWPRLWFHLQALRFAGAATATAVPRMSRAIGHVVRDAARALRRQPSHAAFVLLILGVGISAATVTFGVVDAVLFRPLQLDPGERLVSIGITTSKRPRRLSPAEIDAVRNQAASLDGVATYTVGQARAAIEGVTQSLNVVSATPEFFRLLGLTTQVGRAWTTEDAARTAQVAVISDGLWRRGFAADPAILGRRVEFKDGPRDIVAVLTPEADAAFAELAWNTQVLVPPSQGLGFFSTNGGGLVGGLRRGVTLPQATAELQAVLAPFAAAASAPDPAWGVSVTTWRSTVVSVGHVRDWMLMVLGAVGLVVLIACVNAANVMLTRSAARTHELAIRASLGASRRSLAGTLLAEALMLSSIASAGALLFATWGLDWVKSLLPAEVPRVTAMTLDGRVFGAAIVAAVVTGLLFGVIPAWHASRASVVEILKDGSATATASRRRWRTIFLVTQVTCVAVLLVLSTLFVGSFIRVAAMDLGFDRSHLVAASTVTDYVGTVDEVKAQLARIPGITGVAAATNSSLPLVANAYGGAWGASNLTPADATGPATVKAEIYRVSADYFDVAGIPFQRGATWSSPPTSDWRPIVIDDAVARGLFAGQNPLGRVVQGTDLTGVFTVVGVVPPALTHGPEGRTSPSAYTAMAPNARPSWVSFFLRTAGPPEPMVRAVEAELAKISTPNTSFGSGVHVVNDAYRRLTSTRRFTGVLMGVFAVIQMLIGAAGIYAVTASIVAQQTREFGVRVALGATALDIGRGVLARTAKHVVIGLAIGLPIAWWISRGFGALFFKVQPSDVSIYLIVAMLLLAAGFLAGILPARRAARVDPVISLRG